MVSQYFNDVCRTSIELIWVVTQRILALFPQLNGCVYLNTSDLAKCKLFCLDDTDKHDTMLTYSLYKLLVSIPRWDIT